MDIDVGDMVVLMSELIHYGRAVPVELPVGTPRVIAFVALANCNWHYNNTVPILPPPWAYAEAHIPRSEECGRSGCRKKVAQPPPVCFMCPKVPLCHNHGTGTCSACDATLTAPTPELFEVRAPYSPLGSLSQGSSASVGPSCVCTFAAMPHATWKHWTYDTAPATAPGTCHCATARGCTSITMPPGELCFRTTHPRGEAPTATQFPLPTAQSEPRHHAHHPLWAVGRHSLLWRPRWG